MKKLLEMYLGELQKLSPSLVPILNPAASLSEIEDAETKLDLRFPEDLRELLLCTNGQNYRTVESMPLFPWIEFASGDFGAASFAWLNSVADIVDCTLAIREQYQDFCDERFDILGPATFHDNVIAFTATTNSDCLQIDLSPSEGGTVGQILCARTQPCQIDVLAPSLRSIFELMIECLRNGDFADHEHEFRLYIEVS